MKKSSLAVFFLLLTSFLAGCCVDNISRPTKSPEHQQTEHLVKQLQSVTVALLAATEDEDEPFPDYSTICSGVWVSPTHILTARHCVEVLLEEETESEEDIDLSLLPGRLFPFKTFDQRQVYREELKQAIPHYMGVVSAYDPDTDLALITSIDDIAHPVAKLSNDFALFDGQDVHIIGHTLGLEYTYMAGKISSTFREQEPFGQKWKLVQISAPIAGGNSGGGAFDEQGNLIGICSYVRLRADNLSFFIHKSSIRAFLEREGIL